jgi:hypothetical protein
MPKNFQTKEIYQIPFAVENRRGASIPEKFGRRSKKLPARCRKNKRRIAGKRNFAIRRSDFSG